MICLSDKKILPLQLTQFIHKSPKQIVEELESDGKHFNHNEMIEKSILLLERNKLNYNFDLFKCDYTYVVKRLYEIIFGENGEIMDNFIYAKKGKGWCERYFPPSDNDMYTFIVDQITYHTKIQFCNTIKL
jgi:hypothetical protein